jgi:hypothetical protein
VDALRIKTANEGKWVFLTGTAGDAKTPLVIAFPINTTFKLGKTSDAFQKSTLALYVEIHSRFITWWLVNACRSQQLADATWSLGDAFQIVPAAACARSLLETAASLWVETTNLDEVWRRIKTNSATSGPEVGHWYEITNLIHTMLWASKFDKRAATLATSYGRLQRTNILSYINNLARATNGPIHDDYQWLCNAVHPSIGGMLAFAAPLMGHNTKTHAFQWVCSEPIHFTKLPHNTGQRGTNIPRYPHEEEEREATVENALARVAIFSVDVIKIVLDQALRVIDDIGLTPNAPATAIFEYWRTIRNPGKNANCACRSGKKVKYCPHNWNNQRRKSLRNLTYTQIIKLRLH